jgi:transcription initiation factor TFIID subunit 7
LKQLKKKLNDCYRKTLLQTKCNTVRLKLDLRAFEIPNLPSSEVLENVNPDLSDSEYIDRDELPQDIGTPMPGDSEAGDAPTPAAHLLEGEGDHEGTEEEDGDFDEELAAELDQALGSQGSDEGDSDEDGEEGDRDAEEGSGEEADEDEEDEDDEVDTAEMKRARKLLNEEIRDLEAAVNKKSLEIERSLNPLIRVSDPFEPT